MTTDKKLEIQGIVQRHPVPELLVEIDQAGFSGSLRLSDRDQKAIVYAEKGRVAFAVSNLREHRLFSILLSQGRIEEADLSGIEGFTNDQKLVHGLISKGILSEHEAEEIFKFQVRAIIASVIGWRSGNWVFSPLARLKEGLRLDVDLRSTLFRSSREMTDFEILARFKSYDERFGINSRAGLSPIPFTPQEAFVHSRVGEAALTIEEIQAVSGLEANDLMPILYRLWLGGFIFRENWNKAFNKETVEKFQNAKVLLSQSARSVEEEERLKREAEDKAAEAAEREQRAKEEKQRLAKERKEREQAALDADFKEVDLSVEEYLSRVTDAPTYYELFGIDPDAKLATIKRAYFSFARRFHPDVFHKKVDPELHSRIQKAFTEIAEAYETLRHDDRRESYDLKLEKVIDALKRSGDADLASMTKDEIGKQDQAAAARESFDRGMDLLDEGRIDESVPYLGRAVQLNGENAEYRAFYGFALSSEKRNRHKAESELREAVRLAPFESRYRLMLVELYVEIGLSVRARNELARLLEKEPGNSRARELLRELN